MAEWNPKSLTKLVLFFLFFLLLFNTGGYLYGPTIVSFPFSPTNRGYITKLLSYSVASLPISIEAYPSISKPTFLSLWCGEDLPLSEQQINLKKKHNIGILSLCEPETIDVYPQTNNSGLWIETVRPSANLIMLLSRLFFLSLLGLTFYALFKNGKNFSSLRSSLINCVGCIFIIDPLNIFHPIIPDIQYIHMVLTCFGWWRTSAEIFSEYAPLVQASSNFYKKVAAAPTLILLVAHITSLAGIVLPMAVFTSITIAGAAVLPVAAVWFLVRAGNTAGRAALFVHVTGGVSAMSLVFLAKMMALGPSPPHMMLLFTVEISFAGTFGLFHALLEAGESRGGGGLSSQAVRRYDKIDELLDTLGEGGEGARFGVETEELSSDDAIA